jgi:hypothetical protein
MHIHEAGAVLSWLLSGELDNCLYKADILAKNEDK